MYFRTIRDTAGQITDFSIEYSNPAARKMAAGTYQVTVGTSLRHANQQDTTINEGVFAGIRTVVDTGEPAEFDYWDPTLREWLTITRSRAGDGVLSIFRIITKQKQAELAQSAQTDLLQSILDTSLNNIFVYEAIRDPLPDGTPGPIRDFRIRMANPAACRDILPYYSGEIRGNTLLTIQPHSRVSGQFTLLCKVVETGQSIRTDQYFAHMKRWYDTSITRLGDGCVATGINITATKQAQEQATANLQAVIDNARIGIFVITPIADETGQYTDFRFKTINRFVASLAGQLPETMRGTPVSDWFATYRRAGLFDHYKRTYDTGDEQHVPLHYTVDGTDHWFDIRSIKLGDDVLVTFTDFTDLKQAQQAVEQQAALINGVLDSSANGIMAFESVRDGQGNIIDFSILMTNEAGAALVNQPMAGLPGKTLLSLFPGALEAGLFESYVTTTETGEPFHTETYYNYDGLDFWLDISAQRLGDGFVTTFIDISVIKRAQSAVEQSANELRAVINSAQAAIFLMQPIRDATGQVIDFRFRIANQMLAQYAGQETDALLNTPVSQWFPAYLTNGLFEQYRSVLHANQTRHFSFHYDADGINAWLNITAAHFGGDVLVTFSDFTDLKLLQQQLEASTTELQTIIDTSQTGIFLFSPIRDERGDVVDFRFQVANQQLASYVGQKPETVIGGLGSVWFPDYQTNGLFDAYRQTYLTGETLRFDFHYYGSGIDVWLDIMSTKMGDEVLVTFGDYTPLKRLQQQLEASVIELQRSNENLEQFAYVASHDLQEPLRKILAFGDIIQTEYAPVIGDTGADLIQRMQSAASRMQVLIRDVLAYSRVATKREAVRPVNLNTIVADVLTDLETAIADRQAVVRVAALPTLTGDAGQLRQLFQNLLGNALKFAHSATTSPVPPHIDVTTQLVRGMEAGIPVSPADAQRQFHCIEVTDNGIGFDPHQGERIFQVFQRLHGRSGYQGTGIGLAIVKKVIDNHQGYIRAEGRPGQGATFRLLLPGQ